VKSIKDPTKETEKSKEEALYFPSEIHIKKDLYKVLEVMQMLHVSKTKMYQLIKTGEIEHIRIGKHYRIPGSALVKFSRSGKNS